MRGGPAGGDEFEHGPDALTGHYRGAVAPVRYETRMSDHEALMWALEDDPVLRSSFANVTVTDQPVDVERFRERMAVTVRRVRRLRQRVVEPPGFAAPRWEDDPMF